MGSLTIVTRDGVEHQVEGEEGLSLMEIIRAKGFDELLALCGGCCSCATCHVHVEPAFLGKLAPMSEDEDDLLEGSNDRDETSRLACQIPFRPELEGLRLRIAEPD